MGGICLVTGSIILSKIADMCLLTWKTIYRAFWNLRYFQPFPVRIHDLLVVLKCHLCTLGCVRQPNSYFFLMEKDWIIRQMATLLAGVLRPGDITQVILISKPSHMLQYIYICFWTKKYVLSYSYL